MLGQPRGTNEHRSRLQNCGHFVAMFAEKRRHEPRRRFYLTAIIATDWDVTG